MSTVYVYMHDDNDIFTFEEIIDMLTEIGEYYYHPPFEEEAKQWIKEDFLTVKNLTESQVEILTGLLDDCDRWPESLSRKQVRRFVRIAKAI